MRQKRSKKPETFEEYIMNVNNAFEDVVKSFKILLLKALGKYWKMYIIGYILIVLLSIIVTELKK